MVKKIFIAGLPRSGTTMVQNILDSHSKVYGGSEFDRIPNIITLRNQLRASVASGRISEYTSQQAVDKHIIQLIEGLFSGVTRQDRYEFISEKTPWNILFFKELHELFPEAKFVMVLRNPLAVYSSMKQVARRAREQGVTPPDFTVNYKLAVAYMEAVYKHMRELLQLAPKTFYLLRYEDLLDDLEVQSKQLCDFLKLPWEPQLLEFYKLEHPGQQTMTANGIWYSSKMYGSNPAQKKASPLDLSFAERAFITYAFAKNTFVNPQYRYFNLPSLPQRLFGKLNYGDYKQNYRFNYLPKRTLG